MDQLTQEKPPFPQMVKTTRLWDLEFQAPIFNGAGMFKDGYGYEMSARQGAGAFLAGTVTRYPRTGNKGLPFLPLPKSKAALNALGLPNPGHLHVAPLILETPRISGCPIGVSVQMEKSLVPSLWLYYRAGVDFVEINVSCPNTQDTFHLVDMLREVQESFISKVEQRVPVILKVSSNLSDSKVQSYVSLCVDSDLDGLTLGNTGTHYNEAIIHPDERLIFDSFVQSHGGGISGNPIKDRTLEMVKVAKDQLDRLQPQKEFHLIRCGGVETAQDVKESLEAGASLCQWFTGYFEQFGNHGHQLYHKLLEQLEHL